MHHVIWVTFNLSLPLAKNSASQSTSVRVPYKAVSTIYACWLPWARNDRLNTETSMVRLDTNEKSK